MAQKNMFTAEVEALDSGQGYLLRGTLTVNGARNEINEHFATEAAVRTRLGTGFDLWAAQVDAE
jgi:hypothetical protein